MSNNKDFLEKVKYKLEEHNNQKEQRERIIDELKDLSNLLNDVRLYIKELEDNPNENNKKEIEEYQKQEEDYIELINEYASELNNKNKDIDYQKRYKDIIPDDVNIYSDYSENIDFFDQMTDEEKIIYDKNRMNKIMNGKNTGKKKRIKIKGNIYTIPKKYEADFRDCYDRVTKLKEKTISDYNSYNDENVDILLNEQERNNNDLNDSLIYGDMTEVVFADLIEKEGEQGVFINPSENIQSIVNVTNSSEIVEEVKKNVDDESEEEYIYSLDDDCDNIYIYGSDTNKFDMGSEDFDDIDADTERVTFEPDNYDLDDIDTDTECVTFEPDNYDLDDIDTDIECVTFEPDSEDINEDNKFSLKVVANRISKDVNTLKDKLKSKMLSTFSGLSQKHKVKSIRNTNDELKLKKNILKAVAASLVGVTLVSSVSALAKNKNTEKDKDNTDDLYNVVSFETEDTPDYVYEDSDVYDSNKDIDYIDSNVDSDSDTEISFQEDIDDSKKNISSDTEVSSEEKNVDDVQTEDIDKNIVLDFTIKLNDDSLIYDNMYDASNKTRGFTPYFGTEQERQVGGVALNYQNNMTFIKYTDDNAQEKINYLINNGASVEAVCTVNDRGYEGFYNVNDINVLDSVYDEVINEGFRK